MSNARDLSTTKPLVSGTALATTSGTTKDFTGIPSWAKRITVMLSGVSTSGAAQVGVQLGDSGGIETSGYIGGGYDGATTYATQSTSFSDNTGASTTVRYHIYTLTLIDGSTNTWACQMLGGFSTNGFRGFAGTKSLTGTLDRIRLTTVNGTDTFDAGSANILYE